MKYKTITLKIEISGEDEAVLKTATDLEILLLRKVNRIMWWKRFIRKKRINLDRINIYQFPNN